MDRLKLAVLISGRGSNLQALIDACAATDFPATIVHVISNVPNAYGLERASLAGIATTTINHKDYANRESFDAELIHMLEQSGAELVCLAGFMRILSVGFTERWHRRVINIHPSLLPEFKGLNTHARALAAGHKEHGCTVHHVEAGLDDGPIILQTRVTIVAGDTPDSLAARVLEAEHKLYPQVIKILANNRDIWL